MSGPVGRQCDYVIAADILSCANGTDVCITVHLCVHHSALACITVHLCASQCTCDIYAAEQSVYLQYFCKVCSMVKKM